MSYVLTTTIYCVIIVPITNSEGGLCLKIGGLQKITLLDFPGCVACTVFTSGCNFRCPYCHNAPLVDKLPEDELSDDSEVFELLGKRRGVLDGVAITGGEPLMQNDIKDFIVRVKSMGFKVKLDTNGSFPERLKELISEGLLDYIAMDIKAPLERYKEVAGNGAVADKIKESIDIIKSSGVPYEFRTTVVKELHSESDFEAVGKLIEGADKYYIQCFKDSGNILHDGLSAPSKAELQKYLTAAKKYVPSAQLRGVD